MCRLRKRSLTINLLSLKKSIQQYRHFLAYFVSQCNYSRVAGRKRTIFFYKTSWCQRRSGLHLADVYRVSIVSSVPNKTNFSRVRILSMYSEFFYTVKNV